MAGVGGTTVDAERCMPFRASSRPFIPYKLEMSPFEHRFTADALHGMDITGSFGPVLVSAIQVGNRRGILFDGVRLNWDGGMELVSLFWHGLVIGGGEGDTDGRSAMNPAEVSNSGDL